jgi:hypothetical protein
MALSYIDDSGAVIYQPGAYPKYTVVNNQVGLSTSGVMVLVGEAMQGPSFAQESDITQNVYGPGQLAAVRTKYGSGNIVDAFSALAVPSKDPQITGAAQAIYILKTNQGGLASTSMTRAGLAAYRKAQSNFYGASGNGTGLSVTQSQAEVPATTGLFAFASLPTNLSTSRTQIVNVRVNGGANTTFTQTVTSAITGLVSPVTFAASMAALTPSMLVTGGVDRLVMTGITATSSLAISATNATGVIVVTLSGAATSWATIPTPGDMLIIAANTEYSNSADSILINGANTNQGTFVVTAATATTITAKLMQSDTTAAHTLTSKTATAVSATPANDLKIISGITATNVTGTDRGLITGQTGTLIALAVNNVTQVVTATITGTWATTPAVGDYFRINSGSVLAGAGSVNVGWYQITASTSSTIIATRLSNSAVLVAVSATAIVTPATDAQTLRPAIDGVSKVLAISDGSAATDSLQTSTFTAAGATTAWLQSATQAPIVSASDLVVSINTTNPVSNLSEAFPVGGNAVLAIGYNGTTATMTVTSTNTITTSVTGGTGSNLSVAYTNYLTLGALAAWINAQPGYSCAVTLAAFKNLPCYVLDQGTFNICTNVAGTSTVTSFGVRIKKDAYEVLQINSQSQLVDLTDAATGYMVIMGGVLAGGIPANGQYVTTGSGLPEVAAQTFLTGGTLGSTSNTDIANAILALQKLRCNFAVPLFSRDASLDVQAGLTDPASSYTIASINAAFSTSVLFSSQLKRRRSRQAFLSIKDTFANAKIAAQTIANARCSMGFQDVRLLASSGSIQSFQPWMGAVITAAMQAAGFYKPIFNKILNINSAYQAAGDFLPTDSDAVDQALQAGLMVIVPDDTGVAYKFLADYTTYATDSNFVYSSIQAVYVADVIALSTAAQLEKQYVGQSLADISAAMMLSSLAGIMKNFVRLKLIAPSDQAPAGYLNAQIDINGPTAKVSFTVFEATGLYFIPINFFIQPVQQSAGQ